jgi:hypothetical protein
VYERERLAPLEAVRLHARQERILLALADRAQRLPERRAQGALREPLLRGGR